MPIHFIRCHSTGLIKIGFSRNQYKCIDRMQNLSASRLELVASVNGGAARLREIHTAFASARRRGEWFEATEELMGFIFDLPKEISSPHPNQLRAQAREIRRLMPGQKPPQRNAVNKRKLTGAEVTEIFVALAAGETVPTLARCMNVKPEAVRAIRAAQTHQHLIAAEHVGDVRTMRLRYPHTEAEQRARIHQHLMPWPQRHVWTYTSG